MTEPAPARPRFPRRRVIVGAMSLMILAGVLFGVFGRAPAQPLVVTVLEFERYFASATLTVSNRTGRPVRIEGKHLRTQTPTGIEVFDGGSHSLSAPNSFVLEPQSVTKVSIQLPKDGRKGRIAVFSREEIRPLPALLDRLRQSWRRAVKQHLRSFSSVCDQEIQCARVLPDGTVEPPRLLPKAER